jgi:hypothetical protein
MRKLLKRMFSLVITLAMTFNMFAPLTVLADGVFTLTFTVENHDKFTIEGNGGIRVNKTGGGNDFVAVTDSAGQNINGVVYSCSSDYSCTATVPAGQTVYLNFHDDFEDITVGETKVVPNNKENATTFNSNTSLDIKEYIPNNVPNNDPNNDPNNNNNDPFEATGSLKFIFTTNNGSGFELFKDNDNGLKIKDTQYVDVNGHNTYGVGFNANSAEGPQLPAEITCNENKLSCVATVGIDGSVRDVRVVIGGGSDSDFRLIYDDNGSKREYYGNERGFTQNDNLLVSRKPLTYRFEGGAFFIWECGGKANSTCFHEFVGLPMRQANDELDMNYFANTTITADNNPNEVFDPANYNPRKTGFTYSTAMNGWATAYVAETDGIDSVNDIDFTKVDPELILEGRMEAIEEDAVRNGLCERTGDPSDMEFCIEESVHPTTVDRGIRVYDHAEQGANSYVTFGDNEFKITIYNDDYEGLKVDESEQSHTVDGLGSITPDAVDISGSTLNNPAEIKTLILEDTLTVRSVHSAPYKKVEALNTPEGAIDINVVDGVAVIKFNSNYYDRTVFKFTTVDDKVYYVKFIRRSIDVQIFDGNQFYDKDNIYLEVSFYFDEATSHSDYEVLVSPVKKDGTVEAPIVMKNLGKIDRGGANITTADEIMIGRKTKKSVFYYDIRDDRDAEKVINEYQGYYINVRKKGSTDTNYAGTFAGNGKGLFFVLDMEKGPHLVY